MSAQEPFRSLCGLWHEKIARAAEHKQKVFGAAADEAMRFYNGPHDFMYDEAFAKTSRGFKWTPGDEANLPAPSFCMTVNKVAELVQLFGPTLYHKNPYRLVRPRERWVPPPDLFFAGIPTDPAALQRDPVLQQQAMAVYQRYQQLTMEADQAVAGDKARADLLEAYLNFTPDETGLKDATRDCIEEALIKGRGLLWTELWSPPGSRFRFVRSSFETVDKLVIDPDMETVEDAQWVARECCHPVWEVEAEYGLPPGTLRGSMESMHRQAQVDTDNHPGGTWSRKQGTSNDLIRYWKVWSKMGLGAKLAGAPPGLREQLDKFGEYVYLVVCKEVPYPLNFPPEQAAQVSLSGDEQAAQQLLAQLQWPVPFWADGGWPFTELDFHKVPRCVWPMSHIWPAMGEQKFLNWAYSFLAGKIRNTCRDFVAVLKAAGEDLKAAIMKGEDLTLLEIEAQFKTISDVVQFLQHPPMNGDIFTVIQAVEQNFERRTGLSELMYGESARQYRSAEEANVKANFLQIRPDDMADRVEDFAKRVARKEAILARASLTGQDVGPALGAQAAMFWDQFVASADVDAVCRELDYRVEAGSTRKPNKDRDLQNINEGANVILPALQQYAFATGDVNSMNAFLTDWAKARDLDASRYQLNPLPPPSPEPAPGSESPEPATSS
jgi:hypothetical protein